MGAWRSGTWLFLALVAAPAWSGGGEALEDRHAAALATNPADVTFELRLGGGRTRFFQGEIIPLELAFSSRAPERYRLDAATYDRSGRTSLESFHLEPAGAAADPLRDYYATIGIHSLGGLRHMPLLEQQPAVVELVLNEWLRFDRHGDYRLFVTSRRLEDLSAGQLDSFSGAPVAVASNVIELFILPAQPGWAARTLERAREDVASRDPDRRRQGCSTLRHLGTPESIAELITLSMGTFDGCPDDATLGLFGHPDRRAVVAAMATRLQDPDGVVDASFVHRLARLSWLGEHPPPAADAERTPKESGEIRRGIEGRAATYAARLAGSIGDKRGPARASSLLAMFETAERSGPLPAELDALRPELAAHFEELRPEEQQRLLDRGWHLLRDPSFRPVLQRLYENPPTLAGWPEGTSTLSYPGYELRHLAIRRLHDLEPAAAREILVAELSRPRPRLAATVFAELLPDAALPAAAEAAVVENLRQLEPGLEGLTELAAAVGRFGSPAIRDQVEALYDSDRFQALDVCWRSPFLAYFLRVDPEAGVDRLEQALARPGLESRTGCADLILAEVAAFGIPPALERVAIELLESGDYELERAAVEVLGGGGSVAAEALLWRRLERWHQEWKDRPEKLRYDRVSRQRGNQAAADLESALIEALSRGVGWVADHAAVERLGHLALTEQSKRNVEALATEAGAEVRLGVWSLEPSSFRVAHYDADSVDALKSRLELFPEGTVFRWSSAGNQELPAEEALFAELETWLAQRGKGLVR